MEWLQIAAWVVWAWVGISTALSLMSIFVKTSSKEEMVVGIHVILWSLQAILGLLLIRTLGLTV